MVSLIYQRKCSPGRKSGDRSRSETVLCLALAAVLAVPTALTLLSSPKLARQARDYDRACALAHQTENRSGWHEEPAVVLGEAVSHHRSKTWKIQLALWDGEKRTILVSRGNLRGFVAPGSPVRAEFWHGKITRLQCGDRQAETWDNPDWLLFNNRVGTVMCSLLLLGITLLLLCRVRFRIGFRIRVPDR